MTNLKPCPFCGNESISVASTKVPGATERFFVMCTCCSAKIERTSMFKAVSAWERRAENDR